MRIAIPKFTVLLFLVVLFSTRLSFGEIEVHPEPGGNSHRSDSYSVEVFNGSSWVSSYVYKYSRMSVTLWHNGASPAVNFTTFGVSGPTKVRITKTGSSITSADVSPKSKDISLQVNNGKATVTVNQNHKIWLVLNGDDANPLFIFADGFKPPVPAGATYFGPGVHQIAPGNSNHYLADSYETIYLDGGAWVMGTIDLRGTTDVKVMGPGILSGELWAPETIDQLPFEEKKRYMMIRGDWAGNNAAVEGITIVASPSFNFFAGTRTASNVKLLSPWYYSTDGFQAVNHVDQSFAFVGDNVFFPMWAGVGKDHVTVTNSFAGTTNNSVFVGGFWGNAATNSFTAIADNIDIKTYNSDAWVAYGSPLTAALVEIWIDNADDTKQLSNQTYQNIRVEGNVAAPLIQLKNMVYPWGGPNAFDPPLDNAYNMMFKNIFLQGTQKLKSEIKGWDAENAIDGVTLQSININGARVNASNFSTYFDVNSWVYGMTVSQPDTTVPATAITSPLNNGRVTASSTVTITATASDNTSVQRVEFSVNSIFVCTDTNAPYTCAWDVPKGANKKYKLQTKAYDAAGNSRISTAVQVTSKN